MQSARFQSLRAVGLGTTVIVAGSLMMTTLVGIAAISGMLARGDTPEMVANQLAGSLDLAIFVRLAELLMSAIGGYAAARLANRTPLRHAFAAGALATLLNLGISALCGETQPAWIVAPLIALTVPFAILGAWLAMPISTTSVVAVRR